jgi:arginyl-tRNA synthetase
VLPHKQIEQLLQDGARGFFPDADVSTFQVRPCPDPKFGDYQCSALMSLAKAQKKNPRQLAADFIDSLRLSVTTADLFDVEIAGAGFLNFRLKSAALTQTLEAAARGEHLFFENSAHPKTVVFDFSSPNVAKPMHVGHIRSTTLGDCLARTSRLLGHNVITDNHIGDWGTQFGMLILGWRAELLFGNDPSKLKDPVSELERIYKIITAAGKGDPEALLYLQKRWKKDLDEDVRIIPKKGDENVVLERARQNLVKLQNGDRGNLHIWRQMLDLSQKQFDEIYSRLGVKFDFWYGESFYNDRLKPLVDDLLAKKIARESEGAVGVFSDGSTPPKEDVFLVHRDGEWVPDPALIRKSDGGFNYMTTDLATIDFRLKTWSPDEIVYVVDDRQSSHFKKLFATFARWQPEAAKKVKMVHVGFGKILGEDGKPFKTRSGDTVKLGELLDEAEERAFKIVSEKNPDLTEAQRHEIGRVIGLSAVKYADLLPNRQSDYVFSWDKMLALNGNTAPYLQYAYARIRSIFRKAGDQKPGSQNLQLALSAPEEISLAKHLLNFGLTLQAVGEEFRPNFLCNFLFELAGKFTAFYENCPILKADEATRQSRLILCDLTARVLKQGLEVLGIEVVEQM